MWLVRIYFSYVSLISRMGRMTPGKMLRITVRCLQSSSHSSSVSQYFRQLMRSQIAPALQRPSQTWTCLSNGRPRRVQVAQAGRLPPGCWSSGMAITDRSAPPQKAAKQSILRPPVSAMDAIDDLYENNAFGDEEDEDVDTIMPIAVGGKKQLAKSPPARDVIDAKQSRGSDKDNNGGGVQFNVWVARKDKYERMALALSKLNTERAADDSKWLDVAVALAATDCALKTGRSERCDCPGVCRNSSHAVTRQRTRCQCPAKKCSLCGRCVNTAPGQITSKMAEVLAPLRPGVTSNQPPSVILSIAEEIVSAGEGKCLAPGAPKISRAAVRMAQAVMAQCSVLEGADGSSNRVQRPCSCPLRSLGELWVKWTTRYHTFSRVPLTEKEASQFAIGTRQMMEHDDAEPDKYYMTLKWHQAAKPQKGDTAKIAARRQLTPDQKKQNALFLTLCKRYWKQAQHRVVEQLQTKLGEFEALPVEKKLQLGAVLASSIPASSSNSLNGDALAVAALELQTLNKLGVKRMLQWVEEDLEAIDAQKRDELKEKAEGGLAAHNAWVRKKDRLRIRMPTPTKGEVGSGTASRMDFSNKGAVRRKNFKAPSTTVELMRNSGLKYVHAMNDGFQGRGGDLEKCKQLLVKQGHVLKANFNDSGGGGYDDEDSGFSKDRYHYERANNPARKKRNEGDKARRQQSQASFASWTAHKALRDKALKFLDHLPSPSEDDDSEPQDQDEAHDFTMTRWEQIGRALKAVDRTLLEAWVRWTGGFRSAAICRALWESFPPVACDVHCASSAIRDVFLKLLHRRGINYRQAFADHCERKYKRAMARRDNGDEAESDLPDDMNEQQQMDYYATMNRREFTRFLADQGIIVQPEEAQRLVEYFSYDEESGDTGDERVSMPKFLSIVGDERRIQCHGDTDMLLRHVCMWETVCHECGMLRAFQLVVSNTSSSSGGGGSRLRAELPGHVKRREQANSRFNCSPECDLRVVKKIAPTPCSFSKWSDEQALPFLKKLELWSAAPREQRVLQQLVTNGQPPDAPPLYRIDREEEIGDDGDNNDNEKAVDSTTMLLLRWAPPRVAGNNGAAFYQLETAGAEGTLSFRKNEFREICRDPRDFSDNGGKPRYQFLVTGLSPNTKYAFRVRALNGFGAGPYTLSYFVTAPASPPTPVAVKVSPSSIALAWDTSRSYQRQLKEIRRVFDSADVNGDGVISRDEFMDQLERREPRLLEFLQRVTMGKSSSNGPPLSVFDVIETDDSENLSWQEFLGFFHGVLEGSNEDVDSDDDDPTSGKLSRVNSRSQLPGGSVSTRTAGTLTRKRADASPGSTAPVGACRFILKQCTNEAEGEYVEIYRGTTPSFVVHGLASGSTFQFRVQAENEEGRRSLHSPPLVVNTLLATPAPPVECASVGGSAVKLKWSAATARPSVAYDSIQQRNSVMVKRQGGSSLGGAAAPKQSDEITRLLKEWAQETSFDEGGVDFRARFDRLDVDKSGYIELPEFRSLLAELGVTPSDERMAAYLAEFDTDSDGKISFSEFARWWNNVDDVQYVLKRDSGQRDDQAEDESRSAALSDIKSSEMSIVSYRGKDTSAVVAGLEPNTLYRFRLRVVGAHASSQLSDALEMWTVPHAPSRPGRVCVSCTSALLRWHPGVRGASKFVLELKLIETLGNESGAPSAGRSAPVNGGNWTNVYEGSEPLALVTELLPSTVYRARVFALNRVGGLSDQSTVMQVCTPGSREEERAAGGGVMRPSNAAEHFTIECGEVGDLVRGDSVLFCERLYRNADGRTAKTSTSASVYSMGSAAGSMIAIGERTVAARVVSVKMDDKYGRVLSMIVLWSTAQLYDDQTNDKRSSTSSLSSKRAAGGSKVVASSGTSLMGAGHVLASDLKISRREKSLYRFDTFRKEWVDERARLADSWDQ